MHSHSSDKVIELHDINMSWNERQVLSGVNLTVKQNDFLAITGPNGGGKSTLLRIILKLLKPTTGRVIYFDNNGHATDRLHIGYLPQKNMIDAHFPITVSDVIASGLYGPYGKCLANPKSLVDETLDTIELSFLRNAPIGSLSGGQLQRALLGRAIISKPQILVLDEPLSYLDKHFEHCTYKLLEQLAPYTTILLVSHEMTTIASMATRHLIVDHTLHECTAHHHYVKTECE
ncbi:MAG: ATP-binding cassette domain-containing protein [Clostridiales bacterium]|nr:ATP-binding cassette domain-containing protein [Clostridiales bacterium]